MKKLTTTHYTISVQRKATNPTGEGKYEKLYVSHSSSLGELSLSTAAYDAVHYPTKKAAKALLKSAEAQKLAASFNSVGRNVIFMISKVTSKPVKAKKITVKMPEVSLDLGSRPLAN
jgi:hypothetical protein